MRKLAGKPFDHKTAKTMKRVIECLKEKKKKVLISKDFRTFFFF
jgi:hypothetical protein